MSDSNSRLVYSTETGRIDEAKPAPGAPERRRHCRIQRQARAGHARGKGSVCLISGIDTDDAALTALAAELKRNATAAAR